MSNSRGQETSQLPTYLDCKETMEDGGVDRTVIDYRQNQFGQRADFPNLITILVFSPLFQWVFHGIKAFP